MHCLFEDIGVQRGNLEQLAAVPTSRLLEASSAALHKITGGDAPSSHSPSRPSSPQL